MVVAGRDSIWLRLSVWGVLMLPVMVTFQSGIGDGVGVGVAVGVVAGAAVGAFVGVAFGVGVGAVVGVVVAVGVADEVALGVGLGTVVFGLLEFWKRLSWASTIASDTTRAITAVIMAIFLLVAEIDFLDVM